MIARAPVINPHRLRVLRAVLAAGSIHGAARNLHYSPATVSQHMTELTRETGLELFTRSGRGLVPTPAAVHLSEQAGEALAGLDRLDQVVTDLREGRDRQLTISTFSSAAKHWLPDVVTAVRAQDPGLTFEISLNESQAPAASRPVDIDVQQESLEEAEQHFPGYIRQPLGIEDFEVVLPVGHPLAEAETATVHELRDLPWIDQDIYDSPVTRIIRSACRAAGFTPRVMAKLDDHYAALGLVEAGAGITVLTRLAALDAPVGVAVRPLVNPRVQRRVVAHIRKDSGSTPPVATAMATLERLAQEAGLLDP